MRKLSLALLIPFVVTACHATYQVSNLSGAHVSRLDGQRSVYVVVPRDGTYGSTSYAGSGQIVAQAVAAAFSKFATRVSIATKAQTDEEGLDAARTIGAGYVVVPAIVHWEQRATQWSGIPSTMSVRVTVLEAASGKQISSASVEGRSRIVSLTPTTPESLLQDPLAQYVGGLY